MPTRTGKFMQGLYATRSSGTCIKVGTSRFFLSGMPLPWLPDGGTLLQVEIPHPRVETVVEQLK